MIGTQQWNTANKWWWLCHNTGQSILDILKFGQFLLCNSKQNVNSTNWGGLTPKHEQVILLHPGLGIDEYATNPDYGESMSCRWQVCESRRWILKKTMLSRFQKDCVRFDWTPESSTGNVDIFAPLSFIPDKSCSQVLVCFLQDISCRISLGQWSPETPLNTYKPSISNLTATANLWLWALYCTPTHPLLLPGIMTGTVHRFSLPVCLHTLLPGNIFRV